VILIDHSASMGALDKPVAAPASPRPRRIVRERIDTSQVENAAGRPRRGSLHHRLRPRRAATDGFTSNKRELRDALDAIEVEDVPSDPTTALQLAQALARATGFEPRRNGHRRHLPEQVDASSPFKIDYRRVAAATSTPNLGITRATPAPRRRSLEVFIGIGRRRNPGERHARTDLRRAHA